MVVTLTFGKNLKSRKDPWGKGGCKKKQMKMGGFEQVSIVKHKVMDPTKSLKARLVTKVSGNLYPHSMFNLL